MYRIIAVRKREVNKFETLRFGCAMIAYLQFPFSIMPEVCVKQKTTQVSRKLSLWHLKSQVWLS